MNTDMHHPEPGSMWGRAAAFKLGLFLLFAALLWMMAMSFANDLEPRPTMASKVEVMYDPDESLGIEDVSARYMSDRFVRLPSRRSMGILEGNIWVRITVSPVVDAPNPWWLVLRSALLNDAELYVQDAKGVFNSSRIAAEGIKESGHVVPYRFPIFRFALPAKDPMTLYVRLRAKGNMVIAPEIWRPEDFLRSLLPEEMTHAVLLAAMAALTAGYIWLARHYEKSVHFLHAGYVLFCMPLLLAREGYIQVFFKSISITTIDFVRLTSLLACLTLSATFIFGLKRTSLRLKKVKVVYVAALAIQSVIILTVAAFGEFGPAVKFYLTWAIVNVSIIVGALLLLSHRHPGRCTVYVGAMMFFVGCLLTFMGTQGWLPPAPLTHGVFYFVIAAFPMLMFRVFFHGYESAKTKSLKKLKAEVDKTNRGNTELQVKLRKQAAALNEALRLTTASLEAEKKAREEQQQFFATVSHELRTPLAIIDAAAMNLQLDLPEEDESSRLRCGRIRRAVDQLAILVKNCFDEDRLTKQLRGAKYAELDPRDLFYDAYDAARVISTQHHLHLDLEDLPNQLVCDRELTRMALRSRP